MSNHKNFIRKGVSTNTYNYLILLKISAKKDIAQSATLMPHFHINQNVNQLF